jgi:hypothetical protein
MMGMFFMRIGSGDGAFTSVDGGIRLESGIGSLLVKASNAYNLALLHGSRPSAHAR